MRSGRVGGRSRTDHRYRSPRCGERWDKGGDFLVSFTIVTTAASPGLVDIHHRQPAIIDPDRFDDWLNPTSPTPRLLDMVREPYGGPYDNSLHESL